MSAFIVDDQIINRIVSGIDYAKMSNDPVNGIPRPTGPTLANTEPAELGQALRELNEAAVKQRYPDWFISGLPGPIDEHGNTPEYHYTWEPYPVLMQLYKDISCLIYQCTEGDIPERYLYMELKAYYNDLAHAIVHRLKDWDRAEWG